MTQTETVSPPDLVGDEAQMLDKGTYRCRLTFEISDIDPVGKKTGKLLDLIGLVAQHLTDSSKILIGLRTFHFEFW
jgi:hypothetical protein